MYIYYKYAPDGTKQIILSYVYECFYCTYEYRGKWFVDIIGNIFHVNFLGYAHGFISVRISQIKDHSISVYQARYVTYILDKYLDNVTVKTSTKFYFKTKAI